jgi:hypothetical protein
MAGAQRLGGSFRLVGPNAQVRSLLETARLDTVFQIYDSLEEARAREWPWNTIRLVIGGGLLCLALVLGGLRWSELQTPLEPRAGFPPGAPGPIAMPPPFVELTKLVAAALIGLLVTAVHKRYRRDRQSQSMEQAQVLLCVSGAMMMIIIGNSLARAFGIAGAASIIRFRTPVDDPKDITILFLLMALGMSTGLGAFAVAGLGTVFLCLFLVVLDRLGEHRPRAMMVELVAAGREFPAAHVQSVFARNRVVFEPREISQGEEAAVTYHVTLDLNSSLEDLSTQLMGGMAGITAVAWEAPKRERVT